MTDIFEEMFENKTFEELKELNKMSGDPYIPKSKEEFENHTFLKNKRKKKRKYCVYH